MNVYEQGGSKDEGEGHTEWLLVSLKLFFQLVKVCLFFFSFHCLLLGAVATVNSVVELGNWGEPPVSYSI